MYQIFFSRKARKALLNLTDSDAKRIQEALEKLKQNPRTHGTIKLEDVRLASYRFRVGDVRILFDVDDATKAIEVAEIKKRDEHTYR